MKEDLMVGDGGNVTIYERPDRSRYALDKRGGGYECEPDVLIFGRARFDARDKSSGTWKDSRCEPQVVEQLDVPSVAHHVRRRSWS